MTLTGACVLFQLADTRAISTRCFLPKIPKRGWGEGRGFPPIFEIFICLLMTKKSFKYCNRRKPVFNWENDKFRYFLVINARTKYRVEGHIHSLSCPAPATRPCSCAFIISKAKGYVAISHTD